MNKRARILIHPDPTDQIEVGGQILYLDTKFEPDSHRSQSGTVIAVCDEYAELLPPTSRVIYYYLATHVSNQYGNDYFINAEDIYARINEDGSVTTINNFIAVEADEAPPPITSSGIILPELAHKKSLIQGIIFYDNWHPSIQSGLRVIFSKLDSIPFQHYLHQSVGRGKTMYRMKASDVLAKVIGDEVIPVALPSYPLYSEDETSDPYGVTQWMAAVK